MKNAQGGKGMFAGIMMIAAFLFASAVWAQESEPANEEQSVQPELPAEAPQEVLDEEPAQEEAPAAVEEEIIAEVEAAVEADEEVDAEDFGVQEAEVILPDNPLYSVKRIFRRVREAVTFNPIKKAELKLQHASQELVDANAVLEEHSDDPKTIEIVTESIEEYTEQMEEIQEDFTDNAFVREEGVKEGVGLSEEEIDTINVDDALAGDVENSQDFMAVILDHNIKFNKLFEQMKEQMLSQAEESGAPEAVLAMEDFADEAQEHLGDLVGQFESSGGELAGIMDGVMEAQGGSQFKDLRNIEVLQRLEDHAPEEAKEAIRRAQKNGLKRFAENFEGIHPDKQSERFLGYMDGVDGDETRHMQMLDVMKNLDNLPPEIRAQAEAAKDIMANRLSDRYVYYDEKFQNAGVKQEFRDRVFARFEEDFAEGPPDTEHLRVLQEIHDRVVEKDTELKAEIEKHRDAGIEKFKAAFADEESVSQAEKFRELSKKLAENPDPTTFRLIQEMEEKVKADPKKKEFIEAMEREAKANFLARAQAEGDLFYEKISSNNPRDLSLLKDLQQQYRDDPNEFIPSPLMGIAPEGGFPPGFERFAGADFFEKALAKQAEAITQHIGTIQDPALFAQFQDKFADAPPDIMKEIQKHQEDFAKMFEGKRDFILQKAIVQEEFDAKTIPQEGEGGAFMKEKFFEQIFSGPNVFCDALCQKGQAEKFQNFREQIHAGFQGFEGALPGGEGIPDHRREEMIRRFREQAKPNNEPKPFLDESGIPIPDHKREEYLRRQEEKKRSENQQIPDTIFYRDDQNPNLRKPPVIEQPSVESLPPKPDMTESLPNFPQQPIPKPSEEQYRQFFESRPQPSESYSQPSYPAPAYEPFFQQPNQQPTFEQPSYEQPPVNQFQAPSIYERPPEGASFQPPQ